MSRFRFLFLGFLNCVESFLFFFTTSVAADVELGRLGSALPVVDVELGRLDSEWSIVDEIGRELHSTRFELSFLTE